MLSDEQLEIISEAIEPLFQYLEKEVITDIARRIQKTLTYSRTAELQAIAMRNLGYSPARIRREAMKILRADKEFRKAVAKNTMEYKREVRKIINEITREAYKANDDILAGAGNMSWIDDLRVWKQAGKELTDNSFLHQMIDAFAEQTSGELKNMTGTTGFKTMSGYQSIENAYQRELDKAIIKVCSGTFDQEKIVRDTVHELAHSGLRSIDFASGYSMQLDTAARLAIRTGCHQMSGKIQDHSIEETGENLVYVSKHWGARNKGYGIENHEQWQGKVYFIKPGHDYSEEAERIGQDRIMDLWYSTGYSVDGEHENDPLGLYGYNCRHRHHPWFVGISVLPVYDPEPEPVTIDGKKYDYYAVSQKMRYMERGIRALKRERDALRSLGMDTRDIDVKIARKNREYREFCRRCGHKEKPSRLRYESGTSDITKTQAYKRYHYNRINSEIKGRTLAADTYSGDGHEPVHIGQIDISMRNEVVEYFGDQIRNSDIEKLYIIDKEGNVYYNEGDEHGVNVGNMDLTDCVVLHNHPASNGIVSFGEDDFNVMRDFPTASYRLVNKRYNYVAEPTEKIEELSYNQAYRMAIDDIVIGLSDEMQHMVMDALKKRGYIRYERTKINRRTNK